MTSAGTRSLPSGEWKASRSGFVAALLPWEAVGDLVSRLAAGRVVESGRELDFVPWGGAYTRRASDATAFVHRQARFLQQHTSTVPIPAPSTARAAARRWLNQSADLTRPYSTGEAYPNFPEPGLTDRAYHGANLPRVQRARAAYQSTPVRSLVPPAVPTHPAPTRRTQ